MKIHLTILAVFCIVALSACGPQAVATPTSQPATQPATQPPSPVATEIPTEAPATEKTYSNADFGLAFDFPAGWSGPEEYVSGQSLRVEVGSGEVYPYGELPDQPSEVKNSYNVVVQYDKAKGAPPEIYAVLQDLQDGEDYSDARSLVTRVREVEAGRLKGFEVLQTLPEGAQTEIVYLREVVLYDEQTGDLLTVLGQPVNVEVAEGADWREIYGGLDEANLPAFEGIVDSISVE